MRGEGRRGRAEARHEEELGVGFIGVEDGEEGSNDKALPFCNGGGMCDWDWKGEGERGRKVGEVASVIGTVITRLGPAGLEGMAHLAIFLAQWGASHGTKVGDVHDMWVHLSVGGRWEAVGGSGLAVCLGKGPRRELGRRRCAGWMAVT